MKSQWDTVADFLHPRVIFPAHHYPLLVRTLSFSYLEYNNQPDEHLQLTKPSPPCVIIFTVALRGHIPFSKRASNWQKLKSAILKYEQQLYDAL